MKNGINDTLLKALFISPSPLSDRIEIYNLLFDRIFPDKEGFILFLTTIDPNEKKAICKKLIRLLCFESNFPPSYDFIENLLAFEESNDNKSFSSGYIPQDHFTHILNSYILGVYLFFYHPTLNKKLTSRFLGKRSENNANPNLSASKDFISFWKYFCLFHDIAYPLENAFFYDNSRDKHKPLFECGIRLKSEDYKQYLSPLSNIENILYKEWISDAVARYITVFDMYKDPENKKIENVFIDRSAQYFCAYSELEKSNKEYSINDIIQEFHDFTYIDKLYSFDHLKMFSGLIEKNNILTLLIDKYTGCPIAFKFLNNGKINIYKIKRYYCDLNNIGVEYFLNTEEEVFSERFELKFCINTSDEVFKGIYINIIGNRIEYDGIKNVKNVLNEYSENKFGVSLLKFETVSDKDEVEQYIFRLYQALYVYYNDCFDDKDIVKIFISMTNTKSKIYNNIFKNLYSTRLTDIMRDEMVSSINFGKIIDESGIINCFLKPNEEEKAINEAVNNAADQINSIIGTDGLKKEIANKISKRIKELVQVSLESNSTLLNIISTFGKKLFPNDRDIPRYQDESIDLVKKDSLLNIIKDLDKNDFVKKVIVSLNEFLGKLSVDKTDSPINLLISKYCSKYAPLDHGIMGLIIYLQCEAKSYNVLKRVFGEKMRPNIGTLIWNVSYENYENKLINNYEEVSSEVAKSIFAHNIYPKFLKESGLNFNWKINLDTEPCCYFAMLVDAMQVWNRRKYNHASVDYIPLYEADSYNIEIRDKKLIISIGCETRNISNVITKFEGALKEYLDDVSSFVSFYIEGK